MERRSRAARLIAPPGTARPIDVRCVSVVDDLPRYELRRQIGAGAQAIVHEAWDRDLDRLVAMKVLHGPAPRSSALARFRKESEFLARLDHPNIARVIAAGSLQVPGDGGTRP